MPASAPTPKGDLSRLKALFSSPRYFWITVLFSAGSLLSLLSGSLNIFGAVISAGLWLVYTAAITPEEGFHPRGFRLLRGVLFVLFILVWVAAALLLLYAFFFISLERSGLSPAQEGALLFGDLISPETELFLWRFAPLLLLGGAVLLVLFNLFYVRRGRELANVLFLRLSGAEVPMLKLRSFSVWMLLLGLLNFAAILIALPLRRSMVLPVISYLLTGAGRVLGAFFILKNLDPRAPVSEEGSEEGSGEE